MDFINDINLFGDPVNQSAKKKRKSGRDHDSQEEKMHDKVKSLLEIWSHFPEPGRTQHILSDGTFDFYSFVGAAIQMGHTGFDEFHGTTWLMNQPISNDLIARYDASEIRAIQLIVGRYLKARTPHVYGYLKNEFRTRIYAHMKEGRIHAKTILLGNHNTNTYLSIEGSANFTHNPRTEQYIVTNRRDVYEHHRKWITEFIW